MAINYSCTTIGTLTLCQNEHKFNIQIRTSNCFAVFLHIYKQEEPEDPSRPYVHTLVQFFGNEQHLKNCLKENGSFEYWLGGKLTNIKLNIFYEEMEKLAKYMAKSGLEVKCYYKEVKK